LVKNLDDAIRGLGPVERRRSGTLQDLDALDGLRRDVVETRRVALTRSADGGGVHPDAIDVDDGLIELRQRRRAADADAGTLAGVTRRRKCNHARLTTGQELREVRDRSVLQLADVDRRDGVAQLLPLGRDTSTRHDDFVERDSRLIEREVGNDRLTRTDRNRVRSRAVTHEFCHDHGLAGRDVEQKEAACGVRQGTDTGASDVHLNRLQGTLRRSFPDRSDDRARLGRRRSWSPAEGERQAENQPCARQPGPWAG
jgi:hypothetical protein